MKSKKWKNWMQTSCIKPSKNTTNEQTITAVTISAPALAEIMPLSKSG